MSSFPQNTIDTLYVLERRTVVLASLPASTYTLVPKSTLARILKWRALDAIGNDITDSLEFRRNTGSDELEVFSLIALTNIQFEIFGDFVS